MVLISQPCPQNRVNVKKGKKFETDCEEELLLNVAKPLRLLNLWTGNW